MKPLWWLWEQVLLPICILQNNKTDITGVVSDISIQYLLHSSLLPSTFKQFEQVPGPLSCDSQRGVAAKQMENGHFGKACYYCWQSAALSEVVKHFHFNRRSDRNWTSVGVSQLITRRRPWSSFTWNSWHRIIGSRNRAFWSSSQILTVIPVLAMN